MSRYPDLRKMREAKFATKAVTENPVTKFPEIPVTNDVTKTPAVNLETVTDPFSVTKPTDVTKPKTGRPLIGDKPMSPAERMRRYRQRLREASQ
jgi:hypothetical protein